VACRTAAAACGTLAGGAWWPINRLGWLKRMGARMGVWAMGPNHDEGWVWGPDGQLGGGGSAQKQHRLSLGYIYIYDESILNIC
jgi:hypothetical protein